jgi:hypothetical protein
MALQESLIEATEYRLVLVIPESRRLLAIRDAHGYRLPSVRIPQWTRPAEQLQKEIRATLGVEAIILDFLWSSSTSINFVIAEVLMPKENCRFETITVAQLPQAALEDQQRAHLDGMLAGADENTPCSRVGWIDDAITWVESVTGRKLSSKGAIEQYNAGGAFSLLRFHTEDGWDYWLKASGEPNGHELSVTALLAKLCGDYLPEMIASRPAWNAWLMSGEGSSVDELPKDPFQLFTMLEDSVACMAELQMKTEGHSSELLDAGAFDQSMEVFQEHSADLFDYVGEAMSLQSSTRVPRLEGKRIQELRATFEEVCRRVHDLGIEETIVHGDLNHGNIVTGTRHCQFIDWCEAYIGNPLISLQHLLLLNKEENPELREFINNVLKKRYLDTWTRSCDPETLRQGLIYMPMLAIASTLYGRGDWLRSSRRNDPRRQSYARSLARYMDRAARESELLEALCR